MKRAYPHRNRSFLKIPTELYVDGLQQLELMEQHSWEFVRETIAFLKYSYRKDRGHYRLVDQSEREGLGHIAYFFNEILLANKFVLQTITLEQIAHEFLVWMQPYGFQQLSDDAALRLALHIAVCLHGTNVKTTLHGDVTLVLTDNEDRLKKCTLGVNGWVRSGARIPDIQSNGKLSCTWNTIALITSQIESSRA